MKRKTFLNLLIIALVGLFSSCSISNHSMKTPNYHIEFYKADFDYSKQVEAEATSTRILGVDWQRLFNWKSGEIESENQNEQKQNISISGNVIVDPIIGTISAIVPVLGDIGKGKVSSYALYKLMQKNPGYDVVIYPQYETKRFIIPIFYSKRTVKVKARLGKIK
ncbi:MAG: hypothetical protein ACLFNU_00755 [Bacteroidales bacterium]